LAIRRYVPPALALIKRDLLAHVGEIRSNLTVFYRKRCGGSERLA